MPGIFKTFVSTVRPWRRGNWNSAFSLLFDSVTGSPVGIQSQNASGPDGIWTPVDLSAAQIAAPSATMIADLNATYRLNVSPYTRYRSDGVTLVALDGGGLIPPGQNQVFFSPLVVTEGHPLVIEGGIRVVE